MSSDNRKDAFLSLRRALKQASGADLAFSEHKLGRHSESTDEKVGFRPVSICGVSIPMGSDVVFVRATDELGSYWYVRSGRVSGNKEEILHTEAEAIDAVLLELRRWYR